MSVVEKDEPAGARPVSRRDVIPRLNGARERLPGAVWAITALWLCLLLAWSVLLPTFRSADEQHHVGAALSWEHTRSWPGFKQLHTWAQVNPAVDEAQRRGYPVLERSQATPRAERPSFDELGPREFASGISNLGQHPPGYYVGLSAITWAMPASASFDVEAWVLRLANVFMIAPLPLLLAVGARALAAPTAVVVAAAATPLTIPQLGALGAAVNNDNLLTIACAVVTVGVIMIAQGDLRLRTAVWTGGALAVGLLAKAWALLFVPIVVVAYVIAAARARTVRRALGPLVLAGLTAGFGGWWWVANLLRYGELQPAGHLDRLPEPLVGSEVWQRYAEEAVVLLVTRFWAMLSIKPADLHASHPDALPYPLWFTLALSVVAIAAAVVVLVRRRTWGARRWDGWLLVTPFLLNVAVLLHSTWTLFLATGAPRGLQGRYLFTTVTGMAIAAVLGITALLPRAWLRWFPLAFTTAALTFTASAMLKTLEFHWAGDGLIDRLAALGAWSPLPPPVTVTFLVAVPVAAVVLIVALVRSPRAPEPAAS